MKLQFKSGQNVKLHCVQPQPCTIGVPVGSIVTVP